MYVLGINETHNSSAALLKNGEMVAACQEERFTRIKSQGGFPKRSISFCLKQANISLQDIDLLIFGSSNPFRNTTYAVDAGISGFLVSIFQISPFTFNIYRLLLHSVYKVLVPLVRLYHKIRLSKALNLPLNKIVICDHHEAHAWAAFHTSPLKKEKTLVITNDGGGGGYSGKIFIVERYDWFQIASTPDRSSLASIYYQVTKLLGFTPDEEEYKVMGLSAYAHLENIEKVLPIFKEMVWCSGLSFKTKIPDSFHYHYLKKYLVNIRFDTIAGAVQKILEDLLVEQIRNAIKYAGVKNIALGGGLAMNIKANMKVSQIKEVKSLWITPSSGDESNAIGHAFYGYYRFCQKYGFNFKPVKLKNLYLGPSFSIDEIEKELKQANIFNNTMYKVKKLANKNIAKVVAKLLASGYVVARFVGKMEFGARALGNRSILADPRDTKVVKVINSQIKNRDFWMPFAPTILEEDVNKYLINPKNLASPFMMIGFKTTGKAQEEIPATLHPHDFTCRPQILKKESNPEYYRIINQFKQLTGVGGVLNTSFNLHGEPIVCTPKDAINTFKNSALEYLLIEDFLIQKL